MRSDIPETAGRRMFAAAGLCAHGLLAGVAFLCGMVLRRAWTDVASYGLTSPASVAPLAWGAIALIFLTGAVLASWKLGSEHHG